MREECPALSRRQCLHLLQNFIRTHPTNYTTNGALRANSKPAFLPMTLTPPWAVSNAPGRQASKNRFVFPKCRSSRRSEHCQGGGGGRRGTTLTSAAEPYNASGKHEAHMAGSNCCPDFAATAEHSAYASRIGNRMETSFRTFFGTRFPSSRLPAQGDRRPLFSSVQVVS